MAAIADTNGPTMAYLALGLMYLASAFAKEVCDTCIRVDTSCYNVHHLLDFEVNFRSKVVIRKMAVLGSENTLFFSYEPEFNDPEYFKVAYVNLDNSTINGILTHDNNTFLNFGTFGMDQGRSTVYLGGSDGIFTYGPSKKVIGFSSIGDQIQALFYKDRLLIVKDPADDTIVAKKGDTFITVLDAIGSPIKDFVVTNDNMIVYLSTYGLFLSKKGDEPKNAIQLSKNRFIRGLTVDLDGLVYAWWIDEVYRVVIDKLELKESTLKKVATIESIGAMTFDNVNSLLFTSGAALYRLTVSNATVC